MIVNLLVGGPREFLPTDIFNNMANEIWVGADLGAVRLCEAGIKPAFSVGDFDTATPKQTQLVKNMSLDLVTLPAQKDYTDTEVALLEIQKRYCPTEIRVYGATGGRIDHFLANLLSVLRLDFPLFVEKVKFYDRQNNISFYLPGEYELVQIPTMKYLSFVTLTSVKDLTLPDEKYQLFEHDAELPLAYISNEFVGKKAHFSFTEGIICVIQSKDK